MTKWLVFGVGVEKAELLGSCGDDTIDQEETDDIVETDVEAEEDICLPFFCFSLTGLVNSLWSGSTGGVGQYMTGDEIWMKKVLTDGW